MAPTAGSRNRRITIERHGITYDEWNRPIEGWIEYGNAWASWRRATANEQLASSQVGAQVTDVFEILWSPKMAAIDPKDRLIYAGRVYDIAEVTESGTREGLLIRASARVDNVP
jgi:SPP1 family predicted phage head-tail adaptor